MPKRTPTTCPSSMSSRSSLPIRRASVSRRPTRAASSTGAVAPPFRNQASDETTAEMVRSSASSARVR